MNRIASRDLLAAIALLSFGLTGAAAAQPGAPTQTPPSASGPDVFGRMMTGESQIQGAELRRRIAAAAVHPLGTRENPVRAEMPQGQRAYLRRLRCRDGQAPRFARVGNFGIGIYGNVIDGYRLTCSGAEPVVVYMDMYHRGYDEDRAVPGFSIDTPPARPSV